ncbi:hypothetical protein VB711_18860 [Cronbergia sp. UHCC 0137]|uniref:hypothetical protein n=1 Tax=Cronbergia sp. UHCC 0137 TaxID=3110239 RepID=UPI002B210C96|nr:hypothetical protein [Cronbergia sp. UHCC 0137]MEA5619889.1 hypothetical protein [Cronbergia sp. UHCC 0137]
MVKKSWIVGGLVVGAVILGVLSIGASKLINQHVQKKLEQSLSEGTGLPVDSAEAQVNLFAQNVKMMDIRFTNLAGFPSTYIFKIGSIEFQAERLNAKPLILKKMIIQDMEINIDVKFNNNSVQPQNLIEINAQKIQQKGNNGENTKKLSTPQTELMIQQMLFKNIQVNVNAQLPLQSNPVKEQFKIEEISLKDLNNQNLPEKLSPILQDQILVEVKKRLSQKNTPQLNQIFKPLRGLKQQNSPLFSPPKKPSLPSQSQQPAPPPLP